jgi:hypothetical protein
MQRCETKPLDQYKTILVSFVHDFGEDVDRLHCSNKFCDGRSLGFFLGFRVTRSLVLCVCFVDRCLSLCTFSFGHCVVCSTSIYTKNRG